jgi:hypothetical protein
MVRLSNNLTQPIARIFNNNSNPIFYTNIWEIKSSREFSRTEEDSIIFYEPPIVLQSIHFARKVPVGFRQF